MYFYFTFISIIAFLFFGADKFQAKNSRRRISEFTLLLLTFLGGSLGSALGMLIFNHKTSKKSFLFKIFLVIVVQAAIILFLYKNQKM
ncbi:DUF1294 domain-containing protein [uncultured Chryseobacterium sp.]|uniref:DUF1294 domain-containing protein n=1 Tax=uncultured Chryseobacterium sp. TaxID=259322 RepID=UPI0026239112|nr:DUF1294 domain-containing protein [uncultured Chryseobacterium sp.]